MSDLLAIEGGPPSCPHPFPAWPVFDDEQVAAVTEVLRSGRVNYWTGGVGRRFEAEYAESLGTDHAIAVSNGTVALELALHAIGLQPGEEVIVPSHTFVATASAVLIRGGIPRFADIDGDSQNLTAATIEPLITKKTRGVIAVHMAGRPCEMKEIGDLARKHNLKVIEDCAQAHGAVCMGKPVGCWGDIAAFSFCQDKIITTGGEGGLVVTNDAELHRRAWEFKDHGKSLDKIENGKNNGLFRFLHDSPGTNWRMTEMQAAIGRIALRKLPEWVEIRRNHADILRARLANHPALHIAKVPKHLEHSYYKFYFQVNPEELHEGWSRDLLIQSLQAEGLPIGSGSCSEIYLEEAFQQGGYAPKCRLPQARAFGERSLMLPVHPTLRNEDLERMADTVHKVLDVACTRQPLIENPEKQAA